MSHRCFAALKRGIDVVVAVGILVLTAPLSAAVALAVLVLTGPPVLERQRVPGRHGEPITLLRFRTMRYGRGPDETRLTPLGRWLRAADLDDLPLFWNVVRGDLSLVGPRPLPPEFLPLCTEEQTIRLDVRPGMTGPAQLDRGDETEWDRQLDLEARYVEERSVVIDLRLLGRAVAQRTRRTDRDLEPH